MGNVLRILVSGVRGDKMQKINKISVLNKNFNLPTTRYMGSKQKLALWIWDKISELKFDSLLDLFGGTGVVGYTAKINGKRVIYNDILKFNQFIGKALIENNGQKLNETDLKFIFSKNPKINYPNFIEKTFKEVYFTEKENRWLDVALTNILNLKNDYKKSLALYCLFQSCIRKRPYNLFHRKNLYVRFAKVKRGFGNKKTWDTSFEKHFREFTDEVNNLVFDNQKRNISLNFDALNLPNDISADLVYIDTPYFSAHSNLSVDYRDFYHFLEGLCNYQNWEDCIDKKSKHLRLIKKKSVWEDKKSLPLAFDSLFKRFKDSKIVVSYRSGGIPTEKEMVGLLKKYKKEVKVFRKGFKYALSHNKNEELLFIAF